VKPAVVLLETLRLRNGLSAEDLRAAWALADARGLADLVSYEGCALWLLRRIRAVGVGELKGAAADFAAWLDRAAHGVAARNLLVEAHTDTLVRLLHERGTLHVLLKGAAYGAAAQLYPYIDARATTDVDVLVRASQAPELWEGLQTAGYAMQLAPDATPTGHYHLPPLVDQAAVPVEVHSSTSRALSPDEAWRRLGSSAHEVERRGLRLRIPPASEIVWHGITHALGHDADAFKLHFFLDVAAVWASGATLDWREIDARLDGGEIAERRRAAAWLGAAAWLAGSALPSEVARGVPPFDLRRALTWRLAVFRRVGRVRALREKLLEEGTRAQVGMALTPAVPNVPVVMRLRRRTAAAMARATYGLWCATRGRDLGSASS
jgi:hypothetical protein